MLGVALVPGIPRWGLEVEGFLAEFQVRLRDHFRGGNSEKQ